MRTPSRWVVAALAAAPLAAQTPKPHDVTEQEVVWVVPGQDAVTVRKDVPYKPLDSGALTLDVYYPPDFRTGSARPAVVFVNGVGGDARPLKEWGIYRSWARTVAASGWIGVTFDSRGAQADADIADAFAFLSKDGGGLGIDTRRIAAWACSANVTAGLRYLMDRAGPGVIGAVIYYGASDPARIRTDLPVYFARAGRDNPQLNARIDALWQRAVAAGAPWQMVNGPDTHHAFDAVDQTEESRRIVRETLAFYRDLFEPPRAPAETNPARRALAYWFAHDYAAAAPAYADYVQTHPDDAVAWLRLALSQAQTRQAPAAEASLAKALSLGGLSALDLYNVACAYALLGRPDRALDALDRAVASGFRNRALAERDEDLASIRGDERFRRILARIAG
jgi:dienelactone hydrolase